MSTKTHPKAVREALTQAGLSEGSELTPDQIERAKKVESEWPQRKARAFIMNGQNGNGSAPRERSEFAVLAKKAEELAAGKEKKLGSPISENQAKLVASTFADEKAEFEGKATKDELLAYAQGGKQADLPREAREQLRAVCNSFGDRRLWPRKVVALVLALRSK